MINALFEAIRLDRDEYPTLLSIEQCISNENGDTLLLTISSSSLFSYQDYARLVHHIKTYFKTSVFLKLDILDKKYPIEILSDYIENIVQRNSVLTKFRNYHPVLNEAQLIYPKMDVEEETIQIFIDKLSEYGFDFSIQFIEQEVEKEILFTKEKASIKEVEKVSRSQNSNFKNEYVYFPINAIHESCYGVAIEGVVFDKEIRVLKGGRSLLTMYVKDDDDAIIAKRFESKNFSVEEMESIKLNQKYRFSGKVENDIFLKCLTFSIERIEELQNDIRVDEEENKRVELHLHTKMSEMDGVCSIEEYIETAHRWKHKAISINDHYVVQSFPKAQSVLKKINSKSEHKMKLIYGVEMNMVESELSIVRNIVDIKLEEAKYCVLDFETTGLSTYYDHIIEFGAQRLDGLKVQESLQLFVKPPVSIPEYITKLTKIDDELVAKEGIDTEKALDQIVEFIGDRIIVAHNAEFDYSFLNDTLIRYGRQPLNNPVIDTLDLSRSIHFERKAHRLGNIARSYGITYDDDVAHRADYDTEVLAQVFIKMIQSLDNVETLYDLHNYQDEKCFMKLFDTHINVLVKNEKGLKSLFELITLSHTKYLSYRKDSGNNFIATPKIIRSEIEKYREHLLIGSACSNNEIFEYALHRSPQKLEEAMKFYDFIEIQPRNCYRHLKRRGIIKSEEHLVEVIHRILNCAKKLNKLVVATSDAHYVHPNQKKIRDIYISAQAIGGVRHPLYIYNKETRVSSPSYSQHLLTTKEMLDEFNYISKEEAYKIVVENTNLIADQIEEVYPIKSKLYPPIIDNCDVKLKEIAFKNAYRQYGNPLPKIVENRLNKELDAIIGSGYHVVYYISHLLVKKSLNDGYLVGSRGSVGSSLVATMTDITEVNPLVPHYYCPDCQYSEFYDDGSVASGYDLPDKNCPNCKSKMKGDGQDIPFETFLGFKGDKVPDIDLNFSGVYQQVAHNYTKEVFGEEYVYRAGTIGTVAEQTAFGYIKGYQEEMDVSEMNQAQIKRLQKECEGVKRTTGQHPGGIIVIPSYMDVHDFTPVQYPANNPYSEWKTTHFEFHDIHDNVLKLDILGHVDPTAMRFLQNISGIDPLTIPMNDPEVMKLFSSIDSLKVDKSKYKEKTGAAGLPEFGTAFVRQMLESTKPTKFSELVQISGLSHGTDVWLGNAKDLIEKQICTLKDVIGCRDDIMVYLIHKGLDASSAFKIMEDVRKGKGLTDEFVELMKAHDVDNWYIESCKKIKYMFPKAHAAAYVLMAVRIAWFKIHYPIYYYCMFFSIRCDAYDIDTMIKGEKAIVNKLQHIKMLMDTNVATKKDKDIFATLELALEMYLRGYRFSNIDINLSHASDFIVDPNDSKAIIPPFTTVDGLGENVAITIVEAREERSFLSKEDLRKRTGLSTTLISKLDDLNVLGDLIEKNQMSLF